MSIVVHHFTHFLSRQCFAHDLPIGMYFLVDDR